jgi:large subunit ribosomal protein L19
MTGIDPLQGAPLRRDLPPFRAGDTVRVHVNIREGEKQRIQIFEGVVLVRRGGGPGATFTVRKISSGVGVERIFPIESPSVSKVEIKSRGHVRRARLYYLRQLAGKKARLRSKIRDLSGLVAPTDDAGTAAAVEVIETAPPEAGATAAEEPAAEESAEKPPAGSE